SRPTLTMRPRMLAASRFWFATGAETRSTMRSTPLPPVAFFTSSGQVGSLESSARSQPNLPKRARRSGLVDSDHERSTQELGDLHAHEPDAGAGALHQHGFAALEAAGGSHGIVHGLQGDRKAGRLLVAHIVSRNAVHTFGIGDHIFGKAARRGSH